jgi:hypothetical protein
MAESTDPLIRVPPTIETIGHAALEATQPQDFNGEAGA